MGEFFNTSTQPVGHGFSQANIDNDFACYSFRPKADVPLKVIVLDNTQTDDDVSPPLSETSSPGYGHGSLDKARYDWLVKELDDGQAAGDLMVIAAHVPIGVEPAEVVCRLELGRLRLRAGADRQAARISEPHHVDGGPSPLQCRSPRSSRPIRTGPSSASGRSKPRRCATSRSSSAPSRSSLNSDDTISILTTDVDPAVKDGTPAAKSRAYAVATEQIYSTNTLTSAPRLLRPTGAYNAELVKPVEPRHAGEDAGLPDTGEKVISLTSSLAIHI